MKFLSCFLLLCSLNIAVNATADDSQELATLLVEYKTIQGDFEQSLQDSKGELIQESSGIFIVKKPGFFSWDTKEPFPQLLVSNLEKIWLYDPDLEQVTIRPYSQEVDESPALLLSGNVEKISAIYEITKEDKLEKLTSKNLTSRFTLVPKKSNNVFIQLHLGFIDKNIYEMVIEDSLGQTTRFILKDLAFNQSIDEGIFDFSVPDGVDVLIDE